MVNNSSSEGTVHSIVLMKRYVIMNFNFKRFQMQTIRMHEYKILDAINIYLLCWIRNV